MDKWEAEKYFVTSLNAAGIYSHALEFVFKDYYDSKQNIKWTKKVIDKCINAIIDVAKFCRKNFEKDVDIIVKHDIISFIYLDTIKHWKNDKGGAILGPGEIFMMIFYEMFFSTTTNADLRHANGYDYEIKGIDLTEDGKKQKNKNTAVIKLEAVERLDGTNEKKISYRDKTLKTVKPVYIENTTEKTKKELNIKNLKYVFMSYDGEKIKIRFRSAKTVIKYINHVFLKTPFISKKRNEIYDTMRVAAWNTGIRFTLKQFEEIPLK